MSALEQFFASAALDVVVPDTSLEYPPATSADDWLSRLKSGTLERTQAFFDEQLHSLLTVRVDHPSTSSSRDPAHPPKELLSFISHLQISLEATYISSVPMSSGSPDTPRTARLSAPPRTASLAKLNARSAHPPIFPPNTPNPTPSSAETDKRYLKSEGTLLLASIWGQNPSEDSQEAFTLLWSEEEEVWVAVYRLALTVSFLRLAVSDPLLCLTVSATLRDRPQTFSRPNHPLALFLASVDFLPAATAPASPTSPTAAANGTPSPDITPAGSSSLSGLPEINLLEGLSAGPSFPPSTLGLPTARLGSVSRLKLFTLQPLAQRTPLPAPSPSPMTAIGRSQHPAAGPGPATMRKSFRKTLRTVSGFRVRMRTVFVPAVLLPLTGTQTVDEEDEERDRLEAGTDERTVVLCVELENSGESGRSVGFEVEKVDVKVGGGDDAGARAVLVGWGEQGVKDSASVFPMRVGASEQYNLLYAVSFLRSPDEALAMGLIKDSAAQDMLQRAVTIGIFGRPYLSSSSAYPSPPSIPTTSSPPPSSTSSQTLYPTRTFCSKWNCVLDLSSQPHPAPEDDIEDGDFQLQIPSALPEPASPFPSNPRVRSDSLINILRDSPPPSINSPPPGVPKRHTLPGGQALVAARALGIKSPELKMGYRASTSMLNPSNSVPPLPPRSSSYNSSQYTPPSVSAQTQMPRSPTTYAAPPRLAVDPEYHAPIPMTPAYPSYPTRSALPPTPPAVTAHSHTQGVAGGTVGSSVEIRRERGMPMGTGAVGVPQTPGPIVSVGGGGGFFGLGPSASEGSAIREEDEYEHEHEHDGVKSGEGIVVSVGLVASGSRKLGGDLGKTADVGKDGDALHRIYPLDHFTLDVFVFNQSEWTRRFEVTCPDRRRGRGRNPGDKTPSPGIVPLDNRVRIGPLLPAACQSVRMEFLAVTPGVHSINTLTLTDVVSGYSMNLRSVMDIVVHEPGDI
ncbi:TRAPP trafficking subunit Trs65-domain-containing protein [Mycena rosella]|uniref:TRAPP trafficking subunit Trs65-domain-containing protein n=1 Tax=Mycena rosella TaxID=1033263 RepID=A0AAD7CMF8_MYCRO|nr:TRAPP trafficking subunit Trs65-domain-containing protein [Mycena rosella]